MSNPLKFLGQQGPPPSPVLAQYTLRCLMESLERLLHPSLYRQTLRQIGENIGRSVCRPYLETNTPGTPYSAQDYLSILNGLKERLGVECATADIAEDSITLTVPTCAFGACAAEAQDICLVESGILGGIAGALFGESKVTLWRSEASPPQNCRAVVYFRRSERSAAAEGAVYSEEFVAPSDRVSGTTHRTALASLSRRKRQILRFVGEGLSNKKIAEALHLSVRTIEGHLSQMHAALETKGRSDLVRLALRNKLADL